jgi:hypothetical protein
VDHVEKGWYGATAEALEKPNVSVSSLVIRHFESCSASRSRNIKRFCNIKVSRREETRTCLSKSSELFSLSSYESGDPLDRALLLFDRIECNV